MGEPEFTWRQLAGAAAVVALCLALVDVLGAGSLWLLLVTAGIVVIVWRACGAFVRHLLGR